MAKNKTKKPIENQIFKPENFIFYLAGRIWKVCFDLPNEDICLRKNPKNFLGYCATDLAAIYINPTQDKEGLILTFWHELIHAANRHSIGEETLLHEVSAEASAETLYEVIPQLITVAPWLLRI